MNNPLDFSGKVALVTGAAAGMGRATARAVHLFASGEEVKMRFSAEG